MLKIDDRRFNQLALAGLLIGFLLLIGAFAASVTTITANQNSTLQVRHTYEVVDQLSLLDVQLERAESGRRGYLLSRHPYRLRVYLENIQRAPQTLDRVAALTLDNPRQGILIAELRELMSGELVEIKTSMDLATGGRIEQARERFTAGSEDSAIRRMRGVTARLRTNEYRLLNERSGQFEKTLLLMRAVLGATGLLLFLVGGAAFWLVRRYTRDLTATRDRLHLLNTDLESAVAERTSDLQRANDEIQKFAYIVSHDLRSPLVNVMGFTAELDGANRQIAGLIERADKVHPELVTAAERMAAVEDLPEAVGFIRSSTQKMDRLINAILALSRQGKRVLMAQPLDMKQLFTDIAHSLDVLATERGAHFVIEEPLPAIHHDRLAIEQIFTNLMENATKYLAPGRPGVITVRGRARGRRVTFEVQDNGRGIAPEDHERVFELFRRSGMQDQSGEGIGLANVRALAYRLGGTVTLRSILGEGSTFIVDLPSEFAEEGKVQ